MLMTRVRKKIDHVILKNKVLPTMLVNLKQLIFSISQALSELLFNQLFIHFSPGIAQ
jgi:hypothetical protein